jgi:hypothetical protein
MILFMNRPTHSDSLHLFVHAKSSVAQVLWPRKVFPFLVRQTRIAVKPKTCFVFLAVLYAALVVSANHFLGAIA